MTLSEVLGTYTCSLVWSCYLKTECSCLYGFVILQCTYCNLMSEWSLKSFFSALQEGHFCNNVSENITEHPCDPQQFPRKVTFFFFYFTTFFPHTSLPAIFFLLFIFLRKTAFPPAKNRAPGHILLHLFKSLGTKPQWENSHSIIDISTAGERQTIATSNVSVRRRCCCRCCTNAERRGVNGDGRGWNVGREGTAKGRQHSSVN